jgi:hypothetical protein
MTTTRSVGLAGTWRMSQSPMTYKQLQKLNELEEKHQTRYLCVFGIFVQVRIYCLLTILVTLIFGAYLVIAERQAFYENWWLILILCGIMLFVFIFNEFIHPYKKPK